MVDYDKFMNGTEMYVENEILKKINGYQKWLVGTMVGIAMKRIDDIFDEFADNGLVQMLKIIDENDMIDDDVIHEELKKQAHGNPITIELPLGMGRLTMNENDVDKWHEYIHR